MTTIEAKLDAVMNKLGSNDRRMHTAHEVGAVKEGIRSSAIGPVITHQHSRTMRISHMVEEHNRALDPDKITIRLMLSLGSKNNNNRGTIEGRIPGSEKDSII